MFGQVRQSSASCRVSASPCRPLSRARATLAKRGPPPWPVRRLGAFAQRGRAHCTSWATCREQFGLLFAQSVRRIVPQRMLDVRRGGCWHHGKRHGRTSSTSTVPLHCQGRLEAIPFIAKRPVSSWFSGCAARRHPNVKRQDRALCAKKDQAAHGKWPRKYSVHGIVAQKRRAGVLATASARASPRVHARRETKPQLRAGKVVCIPLLIPQPEWDKYHLFRDLSHI